MFQLCSIIIKTNKLYEHFVLYQDELEDLLVQVCLIYDALLNDMMMILLSQ